jgi:hypothetical protein
MGEQLLSWLKVETAGWRVANKDRGELFKRTRKATRPHSLVAAETRLVHRLVS